MKSLGFSGRIKSGLERLATGLFLTGSKQQKRDELSQEERARLEMLAKDYLRLHSGLYFEQDYVHGILTGQNPKEPEIISQSEPTSTEPILKVMGHVLSHIGFCADDVRTVQALDRYCRRTGTTSFLTESKDSEAKRCYQVKVRIGKGVYEIKYNLDGTFEDMNAEFKVEGPVFM
ncbi:MAG: hypothetical protein WC796_04940 [Candidatus Pacearchaeota archaeon]|jgi:hypothetical protein